MTIWDSIVDSNQDVTALASQLESTFKAAELHLLCELFGIATSKTTKPVYAKRLTTFFSSRLYPRLRQVQTQMTADRYQALLQVIQEFLYTRVKTPTQVVDTPPEWTQLLDESYSFLGPSESSEPVNPTPAIPQASSLYRQFAILYFLDRLKTSTLPSIQDYKKYVSEQGVIRPPKDQLQEAYSSTLKEIKDVSKEPDKQIQYLYSLLSISPSSSRSASPERSPSAKEETSPSVNQVEAETIVPVEQIAHTIQSDSNPLQTALVRFLLDSYQHKKTVSITAFKSYLSSQSLEGHSAKEIKAAYEEMMEQLKSYKYKADQKVAYLESLLPPTRIEEPEELLPPEPQVDVDAAIQETPPEEIRQVCHVSDTHSSLEALADDLSCPVGQACDLEQKQCVPIEQTTAITTLQIGNKMISVVGKSEEDMIREVKKEILHLTTVKLSAESPQPFSVVKKYHTQPIDLDQLWSKLRSSQSSSTLYSQHKVELWQQQLRDKIKKCVML